MKKILIVTALSQELNVVKGRIKEMNSIALKISYLSVWKWNYNTILNLTKFLEQNHFDFVINIWVCWYKDQKDNLIQISRIYNLSNKRELIVPNFFIFSKLSSIASSELPVFNKEEVNDENYVDMESYWIELVCDSFCIPRLILKVPVDKIWKETEEFSFEKAKKLLWNNINYELLFSNIRVYLDSLDDEKNFEKYFSYYRFTFSQREIFKKLYYRFISVIWEDFENYFQGNNSKDKDIFLKDLDLFLEKYLIK